MSLNKFVSPALNKFLPLTRSLTQKRKPPANTNKATFPPHANTRPMSVKINTSMLLKYESVKSIRLRDDSLIIDVRDPAEFSLFGEIPGSINIPLRELEEAFKLPDEQFEIKYSRKKPCKATYLVFSCTNGIRSIKALQRVLDKGYALSYVYPGGIEDWSKNARCDIIKRCEDKRTKLPAATYDPTL